MAPRTKLTETATLEQYRNAIVNAKKQAEIAAIMTDLGYGPEVMTVYFGVYVPPISVMLCHSKKNDFRLKFINFFAQF